MLSNIRASQAHSADAHGAAVSPPNHPAASARILLVDDEETIRRICADTLRRSGYCVDTAGDGETGWEMLNAAGEGTGHYDLLITDNNMPRLSGSDLIKRMRRAHMGLPVIMASGMVPTMPADPEWVEQTAVLPKPFYPNELIETVKAMLHEDPTADEESPAAVFHG